VVRPGGGLPVAGAPGTPVGRVAMPAGLRQRNRHRADLDRGMRLDWMARTGTPSQHNGQEQSEENLHAASVARLKSIYNALRSLFNGVG